jgi:hypothetical protein
MARKAAKEAVPPPINKYGTLFGMSFDSAGNLLIFLILSVKKNVQLLYLIKHKLITVRNI